MVRALAVLAVLLATALAGCGEDGEDNAESPPAADAAIVVDSPESGATVSSPVTASGTASVFEGTVQLRILDADGAELARGFATASAGAPERGEFSERIEFTVDEAQAGVLEAFEENAAAPDESAEDESNKVSVPIQLEP